MTLIDKAEAHDDDLIRRGDADAAIVACKGNGATRQNCRDAIAALPARGVGVTWHPFDTAPRDGSRFLAQGGGLDAVDICSYNARVGCWDCGAVTLDDTDHEPEGYNRPAQWMPLAALEPTDTAHVNETPKSEHDGADVLTAAQAREAAQADFVTLLTDAAAVAMKAREAALREAAGVAYDYADVRHGHIATDAAEAMRHSAHEIASAILALIGEARK